VILLIARPASPCEHGRQAARSKWDRRGGLASEHEWIGPPQPPRHFGRRAWSCKGALRS